MSRSPLAVTIGALVLMSCSFGDDASIAEAPATTAADTTGTSAGTPTTSSPPEPSTTEASGPAPTTTAGTETTTPPVSTPVDTGEPFGEAFGLPDLTQLTALTGGGPRPLLEWEAFDGAAGYMVWVYTPDGEPYWSWMGPDTATHVGGPLAIADDRPGPRVIEGMSWVVVAVDDDLEFLAVSEQRWIGP